MTRRAVRPDTFNELLAFCKRENIEHIVSIKGDGVFLTTPQLEYELSHPPRNVETDFSNRLSRAEAERLAILAEECAEVVVAACKVLRHGYESFDPTVKERDRISNRLALTNEMGDVRAAMLLMSTCGDVEKALVHDSATHKLLSLVQWVHHQDVEQMGEAWKCSK